MDNQHALESQVWLAAAIDGEGTITLEAAGKRRESTGEMGLTPLICITNTNQAFIETARMHFQALGLNPYIKVSSAGRPGKTCYWIVVKGLHKVWKLTSWIRPYIVAKTAQLDLVQEFCRSRLSNDKPKGTPYSDKEQIILMKIRALNSRRHRL